MSNAPRTKKLNRMDFWNTQMQKTRASQPVLVGKNPLKMGVKNS